MIKRFWLLCKLILGHVIWEHALKHTQHVAIKCDTNHFDKDLENVFHCRVPFDIAVANWGKWCNDPVNGSGIDIPVVFLLDAGLVIFIDPSLINGELLVTNVHPDASSNVRNKGKFFDHIPHVYDLFHRLSFHWVLHSFHKEFVEITLVSSELQQFKISQKQQLRLDYRIG